MSRASSVPVPVTDVPPLLTADELSGILNVSKSHVYAMAASGAIPVVTIGRSRRFELAHVLEALRTVSA